MTAKTKSREIISPFHIVNGKENKKLFIGIKSFQEH